MLARMGFVKIDVSCVSATVESYRSLEKNTQGEPEEAVSLAKWRILNRLHDRNETLYFGVSAMISSKRL